MPSHQLPPLYHVTATPFETVNISSARSTLIESIDNEPEYKSPKGAIGFWVSPHPNVCSGFGNEVAQIVLDPDASLITMSVSQLRKAFWDPLDYDLSERDRALANARLGDELAKLGDVLLIEDASGFVGEVVILNDNVIKGLDWNTGIDLERHRGVDVEIRKLNIDHEASSALASWRFNEDGGLVQSVTMSKPRI